MIKKKIKYTDYNGVEREEEFMFNLNQAEVTKLELSRSGGLAEHIQRIIAAQDGDEIMRLFDEIIRKSFGVKSEDGKYFHKSPELSQLFTETEAYNKLFIELCTNAEAAAAFVNGVIPADIK